MCPRWLADALSGKVSLARAFWLYGLGLSVAYSLIGALIDLQDRPAVAILPGRGTCSRRLADHNSVAMRS